MYFSKFKRTGKIKSLIAILLVSVSFANPSLKNRLLVPFYVKFGASIGYNDNVFKFSESEKKNSNSYNYMGSSLTYDSAILKPDIRISYSPKLFDGKISRFIYFSSFSDYSNINDKKGLYSSIRFEYKIGSYNWLKIGYKNSRNNFLRYYVDEDMPGQEYLSCNYDSESFFTSYSINFHEYGWSRILFSKGAQLFNPNFTEFDLNISQISFKHHFNIHNFNISVLANHGIAENISFKSGLNSTDFDRSYNSSSIELKINRNLNKYFKKIYMGYGFNVRSYLSEEESDPLHAGRSHFEHFFLVSFLKELRNDIGLELKYKVRYRQTNSEFEWVQSLKTFYDNQIVVKITYDMDVELFY